MTTTNDNESNETFRNQLDALYLEAREMVLHTAYRTTQDKEDAEDVLQTVFLRLLQRPERQRDFCRNPKGYLYRAAINEALHVISARERQRLTDDDVDSLEILAPEPDSGRDEQIRRLHEAMAKMKPDVAEILNLHYYDEHSCLDIAKMQDKPLGRVLVELFRARAELKKAIRIQEKHDETKKEKHQRSRGPVFPKNSEA